MKPQKKSFGAEISVELADTFTGYIDDIGFQKYRSIEAALRLFMRAPIDIQVACLFDNSLSRKDLGIDNQINSYRAKVQTLIDEDLPENLADTVLKSKISSHRDKKKE